MKQIHTIGGQGRNFIGDQIYGLPSIKAEAASSRVSDRYTYYSTRNMVKTLEKEGWFPTFAQEQNARAEERVGFQKHLIRFRQQNGLDLKVGDVFPELVMSNAHDASSAYNLMVGLFKLACSNGMIVSQAMFDSVRILHMGHEEQEVVEATQKAVAALPAISDHIKEYQNTVISPVHKRFFAERALLLKFAPELEDVEETGFENRVKIGERIFDLEDFLYPKRDQDKDPTLWNTFGISQEKLIRGSTYERTVRRLEDGSSNYTTKVRAINGLDETVRINRGLWDLMALTHKLVN